ncbi:glycosyltransferase family 2 protein [Pseudanabaena sp. FACHB-2040]|uniref:glycosyltransferase family 2 protein n=1 Tax=Pseudanabaena sp. FACHB-2040 TaxID=2692859 RepID=UPI001683434F|nr:glycosyltransferase family 2 protein [Pseudanabaena sp. FACHB-2040]MBD2260793.1 glycosyltransferase family 2 protein [Pseudanabaena sp. FACHB-2040]
MTTYRSVYIIIPVHNRKAITLKCLEALEGTGDLYRCSVVVVDDGSTDGTYDAVQTRFPSTLLLRGDGNLWWTGAIKKGMEFAYAQGASHFIWLNDDTLPLEGSLSLLIETCTQDPQKIVTAQCYSSADFREPTYGGQIKQWFSVQLLSVPEGERAACDCLSGNLVCLPRSVVDQIGYPPSHKLPQCLADIVYTWEAKKGGYQLEILGDAKAICEFNPLEQGWSYNPMPMIKHWQRMKTPKSNLYPPAYWNYCTSFYGFLAPIPFITIYIKLLIFTVARCFLPPASLKKLKAFKNQWLRSL